MDRELWLGMAIKGDHRLLRSRRPRRLRRRVWLVTRGLRRRMRGLGSSGEGAVRGETIFEWFSGFCAKDDESRFLFDVSIVTVLRITTL